MYIDFCYYYLVNFLHHGIDLYRNVLLMLNLYIRQTSIIIMKILDVKYNLYFYVLQGNLKLDCQAMRIPFSDFELLELICGRGTGQILRLLFTSLFVTNWQRLQSQHLRGTWYIGRTDTYCGVWSYSLTCKYAGVSYARMHESSAQSVLVGS